MSENGYRLCHVDEHGLYYGDVIKADSLQLAIHLFKQKFNLHPSAYVLADRVTIEEVAE